MSAIYNFSSSISNGNSANESILALNRQIRVQNSLARDNFSSLRQSESQNKIIAEQGLQTTELKDRADEGQEGSKVISSVNDLFASRNKSLVPKNANDKGVDVDPEIAPQAAGGNGAPERPSEEGAEVESERVAPDGIEMPPPPEEGAGGGQPPSVERPSGAAPEEESDAGAEALRKAEALPDSNPSEGVELTGSVNETPGSSGALRGTNLDGLELPGDVPTPSRFAPPATADAARESGRVAEATSGGSSIDRITAARKAAAQARSGGSVEEITGLAEKFSNPASRISAGVGKVILAPNLARRAAFLDDASAPTSGDIFTSNSVQRVSEGLIKPVGQVSEELGVGAGIGSSIERISSAVQQVGSVAQDVAEGAKAAAAGGAGVATVAKKATGIVSKVLGSAGTEGGALSKSISGALKGATILTGGYDLVKDIADPKSFSNLGGKGFSADKVSNVAGIASGGLETLGLAIGATGIGLPLAGLIEGAGLLTGAVGLGAGLIGDITDEKKDKKSVAAMPTIASGAKAPQRQQIAFRSALGGGELVQ